jgi:hypothetical protein
LTRSTAPGPVFEGGVEKRRSGSTLSKPQLSGWEAEGLTFSRKSVYGTPLMIMREARFEWVEYTKNRVFCQAKKTLKYIGFFKRFRDSSIAKILISLVIWIHNHTI